MEHFWKLITQSLWTTDVKLGEEAQAEHGRLVALEQVEHDKLVVEIARVKREDQPEHNKLAEIYLGSLEFDLERIERNQARRQGALDTRAKANQ